jgi:hypothetical protein
VSHLFEATIGRVDATANDCEFVAVRLARQQIVFRKMDLFVKSAKRSERHHLNQHEHASGKWAMKGRKVLKEIVCAVHDLIEQGAVAAQNVRGHALERLAFRLLHYAANQRGGGQLDIGIEKKNVWRVSASRAAVPSDGRHPAGDDLHIQPVAKTHDYLRRTIG